ncbi:MAG: hypothetical protein IBJ01_04815 [Leptospira sp.]|uniref:hypothetical protein n=1 Tax=Leptospira sp. TaxID=178 RepID=UPI0025C00BD9|nr:hypothetical protein [Leptospira sp.]MBL0954069.1 hypothetical protein [Leptospira sp.]
MLTKVMRKRICLGILMMGSFRFVCGKVETKTFDQKAEGAPNLENQSNESGLCLSAYSNDKKGYNSLFIFLRKQLNIDYTKQKLDVVSISGMRFFLSKDHFRTRRPYSNSLYEFNIISDGLGILILEKNGKKIFIAKLLSPKSQGKYWLFQDYLDAKRAVENKDKDPYETTEIGYFYIYDKMKLESECLNQKEIDKNFDQAVLEKSEGPEPTDEFSN